MIHSLVSRPLSHNLKLSMNSSWLDSVRNRRANGTRQPTDNGCLLREGPIAPSVQNIPLLEPPRRDARWSWVAVTSVKIPLTRGMQNYYSKKCTSLILEPPCFSPWVVKMTLWIFSVLTRQGLGVNDLFLAGRKKTKMSFQHSGIPLLHVPPGAASWTDPRAPGLELCIVRCTRVCRREALRHEIIAAHRGDHDWQLKSLESEFLLADIYVCFPLKSRLVPLFLAQWNPAWN